MREYRYDLFCTILLGLGQLCMFTGYDTQLLIVKPVLESVHNRSSASIELHAGYHGNAVVALVNNVANLAAPWALGILGSKYALLLGSLLFSLRISTFLYIHWFPFYSTAALLGLGYALYNTGQSGYLTEHSTAQTIGRNTALNRAMSIKRIMDTMGEKCMLQLIPLFGYAGLISGVYGIVYPTTLTFTNKLKCNVYLPAYYSIAFGLSNMTMGLVIGAVGDRLSILFTVAFGCLTNSIAMILISLSTPTWATTGPTPDDAWFVESSQFVSLSIAVLLGVGENCINTSRNVICASVLPEKQAQVFAISKFHHTLILAIVLFLSQFMPIHVYVGAMLIYRIASFVLYRCVISDFNDKESLVIECGKRESPGGNELSIKDAQL